MTPLATALRFWYPDYSISVHLLAPCITMNLSNFNSANEKGYSAEYDSVLSLED